MKTTILLLLVGVFHHVHAQIKLMEAMRNYWKDSHEQLYNEPPDCRFLEKEYDFIIVGAGSAGCALASRLTENRAWQVLLIEAGGPEEFYMDIPMMAPNLQMSHADWAYMTEPDGKACLGMFDERCFFPRGKVVGGSSVLNFMIYSIGNQRDYDRWAEMGCNEWSYRDCLPYFKKLEKFLIDDLFVPGINGKHGPVHIEYAPYKTPVSELILQGFLESGYKYTNINGPQQLGVSRIPGTLWNGTRHSSSRAYLHPVSRRPNLHMKKSSLVTKVLIDDDKRAYGVELIHRNVKHRVHARKEVILCAGAINSPQLLMLSGVGPADHLRSLHIPVVKNSSVGYNLQDHIALGGMIFLVNGTDTTTPLDLIENRSIIEDYMNYHTGPLSVPGGCELIALTNPDKEGIPQSELLIVSQQIAMNFFLNTPIAGWLEPYIAKASWMCLPMLMKPKSRGRIKLKSKNPRQYPIIMPNYFDHHYDLRVMVEGARAIQAVSESRIMQQYGSRLLRLPLPACACFTYDSDDYWKCHARQLTATIYHQSGTCKMGARSDPTAVVDPRLRVIGVKRLRVIDVSIMPEVPSGHTNGPTFMVAEKGADMIKEDWGYLHSSRRCF